MAFQGEDRELPLEMVLAWRDCAVRVWGCCSSAR